MNVRELVQQRFGKQGALEPVAEVPGWEQLLDRGSVREFTQRSIPEEIRNGIYDVAMGGPSKSDLQQASIIRIADDGMKKEIAAHNPDLQGWIADAPEFAIVLGDNKRIRRMSEHVGHEFANDHLDAFMNAAVDAAIVMDRAIIAAHLAGIGTCPVSSVRNKPRELSQLLKLPRFTFPLAGLVMGYPKQKPPTSMRLPLSITVMENVYDDTDPIDAILEYGLRRNAAESHKFNEQRFVEDFGRADVYTWVQDVVRQYSKPERPDWGAYIRDQGFNLS